MDKLCTHQWELVGADVDGKMIVVRRWCCRCGALSRQWLRLYRNSWRVATEGVDVPMEED